MAFVQTMVSYQGHFFLIMFMAIVDGFLVMFLILHWYVSNLEIPIQSSLIFAHFNFCLHCGDMERLIFSVPSLIRETTISQSMFEFVLPTPLFSQLPLFMC